MTHLKLTGLVATAGLGLAMFAGCQNRGMNDRRTDDGTMDNRRMDDRRGDAGSGRMRDTVSPADRVTADGPRRAQQAARLG